MGDFINFLFDRYDRPSSSCHCHRRWSGGDRNYTDTTTILNASEVTVALPLYGE